MTILIKCIILQANLSVGELRLYLMRTEESETVVRGIGKEAKKSQVLERNRKILNHAKRERLNAKGYDIHIHSYKI